MSVGTTRTSRTPFTVPTEAVDPEAYIDHNRLCTALVKLLQVDFPSIAGNPMYLALTRAGFEGFNDDFIHMTPESIDKLTYEHEVTAYVPADAVAGTPEVPASYEVRDLPMKHKLQLRALLAFYHAASHLNKGGISMETMELDTFKEFRVTTYDPSKPIVPWALMATRSDGLSNWNKSVKPSARDF